MNVKRFTGRTSRDALNGVRQAFGDDAVVLSTRPCAEGVEVLAMAPDGMQQIENMAQGAPTVRSSGPVAPRASLDARAAAQAAARPLPPAGPRAGLPGGAMRPGEALRVAAEAALRETPPVTARPPAAPPPTAPRPPSRGGRGPSPRVEPGFDSPPPAPVDSDIEALSMSTLSFQDYVRERMLKRRQAELAAAAEAPAAAPPPSPVVPLRPVRAQAAAPRRAPPVLRDEIRMAEPAPTPAVAMPAAADPLARRDQAEMLNELRSMKGLIDQRFGALAFMEKLQRSPAQAHLTQRLLDCGLSPALIRKLGESLPADAADPTAWAAGVLERNLHAAEHEPAIEDVPGVYALIGSTGVGKTTSTAKIAAAFAARHGAGNLGLITLDAYRIAAQEQLRTYGRILGVPVHTAHDRASLEDLLDLLSAKKMVLIDTAGMAQRDTRTKELLEMVSHRAIQKLLVVNAAAQGETIEDVLHSWRASACRGIVLSKIDEAVKLGPALDALIRHRLRIVGVANGQRVPEDWHRLSAQALVQRAMRAPAVPAYQLDAGEMNLVFAALHNTPPAGPGRPPFPGAR